tara:strand:- start:534 stop:821 length:288 start_codon:yes stop_codon:yes gene_type:complete
MKNKYKRRPLLDGDKEHCYLVAYMLTKSKDLYDLQPSTYKTSDHYNIFDGDDYREADSFYKELLNNATTHSANLCLVLKSTEAYSGVYHEEKDNT